MANVPLVSVIVPTFNRAHTIIETLKSIVSQTYHNWECLVIDDNSVDGTSELIEEYTRQDSRIKIQRTPKNGGPSLAKNLGLSLAMGEYIQFLDSDDLICPFKFESQLKFLSIHKNVDIVYSGSRYFESARPNELLIYGRGGFLGQVEITMYDQHVLRSVLVRNPFVTSAPLYRKSVIEKVGGFDANLMSLEDWDFQIRCAAAGMVFHFQGYTPDIGTHIRLHDNSLMRNEASLRVSYESLVEKHRELDKYDIFPKKIKLSPMAAMRKKLLLFTPPILVIFYLKFIKRSQ
jgi:glycosyltransferase involved in cell wall biosynthesis